MLKSNIPVANIRFFEKTPTVADLERRFSRFLRGFRERRCVAQQIERVAEGGPKETFDLSSNSLSTQDLIKIANRAMGYVERQVDGQQGRHVGGVVRPTLRTTCCEKNTSAANAGTCLPSKLERFCTGVI